LIGVILFIMFTTIAGGFFLSCAYDPSSGADPLARAEEPVDRVA